MIIQPAACKLRIPSSCNLIPVCGSPFEHSANPRSDCANAIHCCNRCSCANSMASRRILSASSVSRKILRIMRAIPGARVRNARVAPQRALFGETDEATCNAAI